MVNLDLIKGQRGRSCLLISNNKMVIYQQNGINYVIGGLPLKQGNVCSLDQGHDKGH